MNHLKVQVHDGEQYRRHQNLEIHGLDYRKDENLNAIVNDLVFSIGLSAINNYEFYGIPRLAAKADKPTQALIRLVSPMEKAALQAKGTEVKAKKTEIRLLESLTARDERLLWIA